MQRNHSNMKIWAFFITVLMMIGLLPPCIYMARGQTDELRKSFSQAQREPNLRNSFIESYVQREGLPDHVIEMLYSSEIKAFAVTNPLVKTENGSYRTTSHALAIGQGYPSRMTFGPRMFHPAFTYDDFQSVVQHEGAGIKALDPASPAPIMVESIPTISMERRPRKEFYICGRRKLI